MINRGAEKSHIDVSVMCLPILRSYKWFAENCQKEGKCGRPLQMSPGGLAEASQYISTNIFTSVTCEMQLIRCAHDLQYTLNSILYCVNLVIQPPTFSVSVPFCRLQSVQAHVSEMLTHSL